MLEEGVAPARQLEEQLEGWPGGRAWRVPEPHGGCVSRWKTWRAMSRAFGARLSEPRTEQGPHEQRRALAWGSVCQELRAGGRTRRKLGG